MKIWMVIAALAGGLGVASASWAVPPIVPHPVTGADLPGAARSVLGKLAADVVSIDTVGIGSGTLVLHLKPRMDPLYKVCAQELLGLTISHGGQLSTTEQIRLATENPQSEVLVTAARARYRAAPSALDCETSGDAGWIAAPDPGAFSTVEAALDDLRGRLKAGQPIPNYRCTGIDGRPCPRPAEDLRTYLSSKIVSFSAVAWKDGEASAAVELEWGESNNRLVVHLRNGVLTGVELEHRPWMD
jgi:hypothetical protein